MQENTVQTLIDYVKDLTGLTNASNAKIIRALNFGVDDYTRQRVLSTKRWTIDSTNHGNINRITATITSSDNKISLPIELLGIRQVEVTDNNGYYQTVEPTDIQEHGGEVLSTTYRTNGMPKYYDVQSNHAYLYPASDTSRTIRITYTRNHPRFTVDNLTQDVGVLPIDDEYVALYAADKLMIGANNPIRAQIRNDLEMKKREMKQTFANLDQDTHKRLVSKQGGAFIRNSFRRY